MSRTLKISCDVFGCDSESRISGGEDTPAGWTEIDAARVYHVCDRDICQRRVSSFLDRGQLLNRETSPTLWAEMTEMSDMAKLSFSRPNHIDGQIHTAPNRKGCFLGIDIEHLGVYFHRNDDDETWVLIDSSGYPTNVAMRDTESSFENVELESVTVDNYQRNYRKVSMDTVFIDQELPETVYPFHESHVSWGDE